jgi:hypothetical protein
MILRKQTSYKESYGRSVDSEMRVYYKHNPGRFGFVSTMLGVIARAMQWRGSPRNIWMTLDWLCKLIPSKLDFVK